MKPRVLFFGVFFILYGLLLEAAIGERFRGFFDWSYPTKTFPRGSHRTGLRLARLGLCLGVALVVVGGTVALAS